MDKNLVEWILENSKRGFNYKYINEMLIDAGWGKEDVSEAIKYVQQIRGNEKSSFSINFSSQKKAIYFAIPFAVLFIGIFIFLIISPSNSISNTNLLKGTSVNIPQGENKVFTINNESHQIDVKTVNQNSVTLIIHSNPIEVNLTVGEEKEIDLNDDGKPDLVVKLISITNGVPNLYIQKIKTCTENWVCSNWGTCNPDRKEVRVCNDTNACGTTNNKPKESKACQNENPNSTNFTKKLNLTNETSENQSKINRTINNETRNNQTNLGSNNSKSSLAPFFNVSCEGGIDQFVINSNNCLPFDTVCNQTMDLLGVGIIQTTLTNYKIKGFQKGRCELYALYLNNSLAYSLELTENLMNSGMTRDEIIKQLNDSNNQQAFVIGKNSTCYYPPNDLTKMISGWAAGNLSASLNDPSKYNCTGSIYENGNGSF